MAEESMPGLEESVELVNLSMWVEIAHRFGEKYRLGVATQTELHRLIEALNGISQITGDVPHDLWVQYTEDGAL